MTTDQLAAFVCVDCRFSAVRTEAFAFAAANNAQSGERPTCFRDDGPLRLAGAVRMEIENDPISFLAEFKGARSSGK
jgi:hypothetical protein